MKRKDAALARIQIILRDWDPIDVGPAHADEEYRRYAIKIARMLDDGCDRYKLAEWLAKVRTQAMGLSSDRVTDETTARRILKTIGKN